LVHRRLRAIYRTRICPGLIAIVLVVAGLSVAAGDAGAANTRVSITDFSWSKNPEIDLGERVTWDWLGPDLAHSVTGQGPNGFVDSDPGVSMPSHRAGHTFTVEFDQPGTYSFACKIHPIVRGTVTVSDTPGDPESDPGPQPPLNIDDEPPFLTDVAPRTTRLGPRGRGAGFRFAVDEVATADLEYWRITGKGFSRKVRFAGFSRWRTYIGYNDVRYGARTANFAARPGRYLARLRVTDDWNNIAGPVEFRFEITKPRKPKKKKKPRR
jgi:plastocyanin